MPGTIIVRHDNWHNMMTVQGHILESLSTSVFLLDEKGIVLYLNESAQALIQASANCVQGLPLTDFVCQGSDSAANDGLLAACKKSLRENTRVWLHDIEIAFPQVPQKRQVDCHIAGIDIDADIDADRLIVEIMPHDGHIRHSNMGQVNTHQIVIRGLAHEIRNPLGGMRGAAQLLASELTVAGAGASNRGRGLTQYTDIIIREADRLSNLVGQMQASISVNKKQSLNIHSIPEHVRQLIQSGMPEDAIEERADEKTITTDYDPSLPHILADPDQLIQAFINILCNAEAAVACQGKHGCIVLKSRIDHQILPASDQQQQVVRVDVIDNGEGIDKTLLEHVFEPMVSGKSTGTGLGLSITEEIIRSHDGLITVQSEPGHTVFSVWLKIASEMNAKTLTR